MRQRASRKLGESIRFTGNAASALHSFDEHSQPPGIVSDGVFAPSDVEISQCLNSGQD